VFTRTCFYLRLYQSVQATTVNESERKALFRDRFVREGLALSFVFVSTRTGIWYRGICSFYKMKSQKKIYSANLRDKVGIPPPGEFARFGLYRFSTDGHTDGQTHARRAPKRHPVVTGAGKIW